MLFWTNNEITFQQIFRVSVLLCSFKKINQNLCKRMLNLNHFLFRKFVQDSLQFHALKRHELKSIIVPKVCQVKSTDYFK